MVTESGLVSIGLPVRNGEQVIARAAAGVLAQDHERIELVISDNASDDGTEEICRELARSDPRVRYHRQPRDVGIHDNFDALLQLARGELFKWVGDDDQLEPSYVSRCLAVLAEDPRLVLVTTQQAFTEPDGQVRTAVYDRRELSSDDPVERLAEMLRLLTDSHLLLDPVYGLMRRRAGLVVPRRRMLRQDELFATRLALEGPWGHVPEVLAHRGWAGERYPVLARRLGLPVWYPRVVNLMQLREMLRDVDSVGLSGADRTRAHAAVWRWYGRWHRHRAAHRCRRLVTSAVAGARGRLDRECRVGRKV